MDAAVRRQDDVRLARIPEADVSRRGVDVEDGTLVVQFETDSAESAAGIAAGTFHDVAGCADEFPTPILLQDHNTAAWFRSLKIRPVPAR